METAFWVFIGFVLVAVGAETWDIVREQKRRRKTMEKLRGVGGRPRHREEI